MCWVGNGRLMGKPNPEETIEFQIGRRQPHIVMLPYCMMVHGYEVEVAGC